MHIKDQNFLKRLNLSYSTNFKNQISVAESLLFNKSTFRKFRSGIRHIYQLVHQSSFLNTLTFHQKLIIMKDGILVKLRKIGILKIKK